MTSGSSLKKKDPTAHTKKAIVTKEKSKKKAIDNKPKLPNTTEIDELFAVAKRPAPSTDDAKIKEKEKEKRPKKVSKNDLEFTDTRGLKSKARPLTADGLPIYTAEEMGIGTGGDTPDCPFDCQCCF